MVDLKDFYGTVIVFVSVPGVHTSSGAKALGPWSAGEYIQNWWG